jgi:hypothetical protein
MRTQSLLLVVGLSVLPACGGGSTTPTTPPVTTPPARSAAVTATGAGVITIAPSINRTWCCALRTPVRVTETGGGNAKWNFARMSTFKAGREMERSEITANDLASPPDVTNITPNSNNTFDLIFRLNGTDFDRIDVTLGMTDKNGGRTFDVIVPFGSFSGVTSSPVALKDGAVIRF